MGFQVVSPEMLALLQKLREKVVIGFVGGSDLVKQQEQLGVNGLNGMFNFSLFQNHWAGLEMGGGGRNEATGSVSFVEVTYVDCFV